LHTSNSQVYRGVPVVMGMEEKRGGGGGGREKGRRRVPLSMKI